MKNWKDLIILIIVLIFIGFFLFNPYTGFVWRWYLDITQPNICIDSGCYHSEFAD